MIFEHVYDYALVEDLERRLGVPNLFQWLDQEANSLAQLGFWEKKGVLLTNDLLNARNIEGLRRGISAIGEDASIEVGARGYVIRYRGDLPHDRMKFSLAHEIGHTYWFDAVDLGRPISPMQSNASGAATIEHLCDFFAGALLLPRQQMEAVVTKLESPDIPPLHLISLLSGRFQVADQAVARRLFFQILPQKMAILKLKRGGGFFKESARNDKWRVSWCAVPHELRSAHSVAGLRVPFLTSSRTIPDDMIPNSVSDKPERREIDGRWKEGLVAQSREESRKSFRARTFKPNTQAFVCGAKRNIRATLLGDMSDVEFMYLALPLE